MTAPLVPPLKCQGIKTKLVAAIKAVAENRSYQRWVEPFCGSCVVALNVKPRHALLCDTNVHIIRLYKDIQEKRITPQSVKFFLTEEGKNLSREGEPYYYKVRERFNKEPSSLDFLFLNRSCFNGVMRFNRRGGFNVPYCHKPERFAQAYVTKITNQVKSIRDVLDFSDWEFAVADFRETLDKVNDGDFVYADPPYAGRHVDYFNSWSDVDETALVKALSALETDFLLSTWHSNQFRTNESMLSLWAEKRFCITTREHFYHVGSREELRHPMIEAFVTNFDTHVASTSADSVDQHSLFATVNGVS